jgi:hypothetical protein
VIFFSFQLAGVRTAEWPPASQPRPCSRYSCARSVEPHHSVALRGCSTRRLAVTGRRIPPPLTSLAARPGSLSLGHGRPPICRLSKPEIGFGIDNPENPPGRAISRKQHYSPVSTTPRPTDLSVFFFFCFILSSRTSNLFIYFVVFHIWCFQIHSEF